MDIFNLNNDDFIAQSAKKVRSFDDNIYDPDVNKGQNGVYKSVIRFIPWLGAQNVNDIRYKKYTVKLVNPLTGERMFIDDPSTIGASSVFWNLETRLKKLKDEEPELHKEIDKNFNRFYKYFSLIYIKRDDQQPDLVGKIKVFPHGFKIWQLAENLINPPDADLGTTTTVNPYDLINGRDFIYVAKKQSSFGRDFSGCKFVDQNSPLIVKTPKGNDVACSSDPKVQESFKNFLAQHSPNLSQYFFKEWTEADYVKVVSFLKAAITSKQILDEAFASCRDPKIKGIYEESFKKGAPAQAQTSAKKATVPVASNLNDLEGDLNFTSAPAASKGSADLEFDAPAANASADEDMSIFDDL